MNQNDPHDRTDPLAPLPFDRRTSERCVSEGAATALRLGGEGFGSIHDLSLVNTSGGGLLAVTEDAIEPGTLLSIGFEDRGLLARRGVVQRCMPCGHGYYVAVQFELGLAA